MKSALLNFFALVRNSCRITFHVMLERKLSCQITGSFAARVLFLFADTHCWIAPPCEISRRGTQLYGAGVTLTLFFVFEGTKSAFALHWN